jgi:outer membrane protein OmpA-like peptidoglycan-associated protein
VTQGIIVHGSTGGTDEARAAFAQALNLDPSVRPDPMMSNPDVEALFEEARAQHAASAASATSPEAAAASVSTTSVAADSPHRARGAVCTIDDNCEAGLVCDAGVCADAPEPSEGPWNRFWIEAGYSLTMASAHHNMTATSTPGLAPGVDPQTDADLTNDSYYLPGTNGCDASSGDYCVRVNDGLTAFAHGVHLAFGGWVTERFGLAARLRISPRASSGPMSHVVVGARALYRVVVPRREGFHLSVFGGVMAGQIQVRPKQEPTPPSEDVDRPWVRTGLGGLEVGANVGYRITPAFGLFASPEFYILFPDFSFGLQATLGVDVSFGAVGQEAPPPREEEPPPVEEPDTDGDGIVDSRDRCPTEAEDVDGYQDEDGCPDNDNDGDGVFDDVDQCDGQPEDHDGFEDEDGCPDLDDDQDGVPDVDDQCVREAGPAENHGCPIIDRDGDGVPDRFDNCPDEAGPRENMGCVAEQLVQIEEQELKILDKIYFRLNSHVIERRSYALLDQLAQVMNAHPEIGHIRVEGHTDATGSARVNQRLSERRAKAVMQHLIRRGHVDRHRLSSTGYGSTRPLVPNATTEEENAQTRRVGFVILTETEEE